MKGTTSVSQKQRPTLSQSFSFPSKKSVGDKALHKSIDGHLVKTKVKHVHGNNDTRAKASTGHHLSKSTNSIEAVNSNKAETKTGGSDKKTSLTSIPGLNHSVVVILFSHCLSLL